MGDLLAFKKKDAMKKESSSLPSHIKKFNDLNDKVQHALQNIDYVHRKAHMAGEEAVMSAGPDALNLEANRKKYLDATVKVYTNAAKEYFKIPAKKKGDEIYDSMLMNAFSGTTRGVLKTYLDTHQAEFTFDFFNKHLKPQFKEEIRKRLQNVPGTHIKEEHIDDILEYTGVKSIVDKSKISREDAVNLLAARYDNKGSLTKKILNKLLPDYAIKKAEYRADYDVKAA